MGLFNNILLALCTLHILINCSPTVNAYRRPWRAADNRVSGVERRRARAVNRPIPVNCKLGSWSTWTPCNSCTDKKFRFRYMEKPSQFGGTECVDTLWERLACPTATTDCEVPDYCGESFTCKETGRCISQSLRCNGELDCDDFSDEEGCASFNQRDDKCSTLLPIPGAERGTQGYNVLTGDFVDHVLDPKYYGGQCEYVYNGDWRKFTYDAFCENLHYSEDDKNYRKPYNYHTYHFVAQATSEGSHEYFNDMVSLLNARKTEKSFNLGFSFGINKIEGTLSGSDESEFLKNITKYKNQDVGFVRLFSKVQTANFKVRTNKLMLHEDFYVALMELPEQYDFGMYSRFFNTFGTHYVTEGTMGGTLEYVVVINKTSLASSDIEGEQAGRCFGASIGISKSLNPQVTEGLKLGGNLCNKEGSYSEDRKSNSVSIDDIVTLVKGGIPYSSSGLLVIRNPDTYRNWGATLKYNPALINYEIMPIHELVQLSTAADHVGARLANLKRGWDEYLQQFNPCRCAPCKHNGIPVLTGTSCSCICKEGYRGDACEETHRGATKTDGQWSCWGAWSSCASGRKTRTRTCDNPPPEGGGAACLGSSSQTLRC
ncbi:complement component C8 alpha chain [Anabas testudineus]|uniref:MACPF domain-containing protein n=1 Tax=Anabas testudineus TaxID=64144 RepID=A0A3Q1H7G1_ANATE|nr:complement component C8 alpha chain [Anabas testudineus]